MRLDPFALVDTSEQWSMYVQFGVVVGSSLRLKVA